jgi:hypothetical protein
LSFLSTAGIFLSHALWQNITHDTKNHEFKMWSMPDAENDVTKLSRIAHLLNELPLPIDMKNVSIELTADSINRTKIFLSAMQNDNLCFKSYPSDKSLFIYVGNVDYLQSTHFSPEQNLIVIPITAIDKLNFQGRHFL